MQKNNGRVSPELYVNSLNNEVKVGLERVLLTEKISLLIASSIITGTEIGMAGLIGFLGYLSGQGVDYFHDYPLLSDLSRFAQVSSLLYGVYFCYNAITGLKYLKRDLQDNPSQYIASLQDFNPLKYHIQIMR